MVSKLLLATQEIFFRAVSTKEKPSIIENIGILYYKIRSGLSSEKTPEKYGAFPYDPYSHTPYKRVAQQPGMTGQVKEEIITRMGEFGCKVKNQKLVFNPKLLKKSEFLKERSTFSYVDIDGIICKEELMPNQLGFTYCQVLIIYQLTNEESRILIQYKNKKTKAIKSIEAPENDSNDIFNRSGNIQKITVYHSTSTFIF